MGRTLYCARCLNSFQTDAERCPNLACGVQRPDVGWGDLLEPGDLLDRRYRVMRRLAVGGAGIAYLARETDDAGADIGPELAIKVLFQKQDGTFLRRLANEARVLQDLDHPHIVESRGFVHRTGQAAYLVTLYASGGNLYDHVRHAGALGLDVSRAITEQVLDALTVAHRRGVVHRDLKPQNLFLKEVVARDVVPHVLVADFGIAKLTGFMGDGLTTTGTFLGTPEFAAPEQFKGLPPEPPSDVYAAMCVFWTCLTGSPPVRFADRTDLVGCLRTLRESLPPRLPAAALPDGLRAPLDELFANTLVADPRARWTIPRIREALGALPSAPPPDVVPLEVQGQGTLAPEPTLLDPVPEAPASPEPPPQPPRPEPASRAEPPRPVPREPPVPPPVEAAAPAPRMRLRDRPADPAPAQVAPPRAVSGLDALFDAGADAWVEVDAPEPDVSLDDLLGGPIAPEPPQRPPEPARPPVRTSGAVLDASWETVQDAPAAREAPEQPVPVEPDAPSPPWEPATPQPVGSPATDRDRLVALGTCAVGDRPALLTALADPTGAVGALGSAEPAALSGGCLVVAEHGIERHGAWARGLLTHAHPDVRATAALAVGATGKAGQLALLSRCLADPDARVWLAAVHGLRSLGERTGRTDLVRDWLAPLATDPDPRVRRALS